MTDTNKPVCVHCRTPMARNSRPKHVFSDTLVYLGMTHSTCARPYRHQLYYGGSAREAALHLWVISLPTEHFRSTPWGVDSLTACPDPQEREAILTRWLELGAKTDDDIQNIRRLYADLVAEFDRRWTPEGGLSD